MNILAAFLSLVVIAPVAFSNSRMEALTFAQTFRAAIEQIHLHAKAKNAEPKRFEQPRKPAQ